MEFAVTEAGVDEYGVPPIDNVTPNILAQSLFEIVVVLPEEVVPAPATPSVTLPEEEALVQVTVTLSKFTESKYAVNDPLFKISKL